MLVEYRYQEGKKAPHKQSNQPPHNPPYAFRFKQKNSSIQHFKTSFLIEQMSSKNFDENANNSEQDIYAFDTQISVLNVFHCINNESKSYKLNYNYWQQFNDFLNRGHKFTEKDLEYFFLNYQSIYNITPASKTPAKIESDYSYLFKKINANKYSLNKNDIKTIKLIVSKSPALKVQYKVLSNLTYSNFNTYSNELISLVSEKSFIHDARFSYIRKLSFESEAFLDKHSNGKHSNGKSSTSSLDESLQLMSKNKSDLSVTKRISKSYQFISKNKDKRYPDQKTVLGHSATEGMTELLKSDLYKKFSAGLQKGLKDIKERAKFEIKHIIPFSALGNQAQKKDNMLIGTNHSNSVDLIFETIVKQIKTCVAPSDHCYNYEFFVNESCVIDVGIEKQYIFHRISKTNIQIKFEKQYTYSSLLAIKPNIRYYHILLIDIYQTLYIK